MKSKKIKQKDRKNESMLEHLQKINAEGIRNDPSGSYTGVPEDGEKPLQDADDI